jgi:hypothetical protein
LESQTWVPLTGTLSKMNSFFIGGSSELEEIQYEAIPNDHQVISRKLDCMAYGSKNISKGGRLNKYGFHTQSSGTVTLNLNVAVQAR